MKKVGAPAPQHFRIGKFGPRVQTLSTIFVAVWGCLELEKVILVELEAIKIFMERTDPIAWNVIDV